MFPTDGERRPLELVSTSTSPTGVLLCAHHTDAGPGPAGTVVTVDFKLDGTPFTAINGGPQFRFTEAVSLPIDQDRHRRGSCRRRRNSGTGNGIAAEL